MQNAQGSERTLRTWIIILFSHRNVNVNIRVAINHTMIGFKVFIFLEAGKPDFVYGAAGSEAPAFRLITQLTSMRAHVALELPAVLHHIH